MFIHEVADIIVIVGSGRCQALPTIQEAGMKCPVLVASSGEYENEPLQVKHSDIFDKHPEELRIWSDNKKAIKLAFDSGASRALFIDSNIKLNSAIHDWKTILCEIPRWYNVVKLDCISVRNFDPTATDLYTFLSKTDGKHGFYLLDRNAMSAMLQDMTPKVPFEDPDRCMLTFGRMFCTWRFECRGMHNLYTNTMALIEDNI